ncbi:hypothetical protein C5167_011092 [Papaver somniferum]|uniref:Peptidase M20 dimerisation domain-containing protein n=1 Tax=Papaver somniferum TaxID=3469 RepID=A0A4Y7K667_PAPSO|nr:hypothetical protein C5167_011092 [Papaver somniferum]
MPEDRKIWNGSDYSKSKRFVDCKDRVSNQLELFIYLMYLMKRSVVWLVHRHLLRPKIFGIVLDEGLSSPKLQDVLCGEEPMWENLLKSIEIVRRFRASQFDLVKAGLKAEGEVISVNIAFLKAGTRTPTGFVMNLQPSEAEAGIDIQIPPIADTNSSERRISEEWVPSLCNMTFEFQEKTPVYDKFGRPVFTATDSSNPRGALLEGAIKKANGKLGKPEIFAASTDARCFQDQGLPAIGFSPVANTLILLHEHDEGSKFMSWIIKEYTSYVASYLKFPSSSCAGGYTFVEDELTSDA